MLYPKPTYTGSVSLVIKENKAAVEIVEAKERVVLMVKKAIEVVQGRREIRETKALKATMAIPVTKERHLLAPMEKEAKTERTASRATKASLENKVLKEIRAKEDPKVIQADQARSLEEARMDPKERLGPQETKVTLVRKARRVIEVLTTRVPLDLQEIRAKLAKKVLVVIEEIEVVKVKKVLKARQEKKVSP